MSHAAASRWFAERSSVAGEALAERRTGTLAALFITGFGTFLNLYVTQPLLPLFRKLFGASELEVSLTVSAPVLAVALAAPLVGLLADRVGRKRVIVTALLALALPTALAATAGSLHQFIVWRFLQGLFIPGIIAVAMAYISEESPRHSVGLTMATYVTGTVVGGFAGRYLAGLVAAHWEWRSVFVVLGSLTVAMALATWRLLPRSKRFSRQGDFSASLRSLRMHLRNRELLATYAVGFNVLFCLVGAFTYVNFYLADEPFNQGPAALGSIFAVYLIGAVITPFAGHLLDRIGCRRALMGALLLSAAGMVLTLIQSLPAVVVGLTLESSGVFACQAASSSHVGKAAGGARSSAAGLYVALYYLGGCVGSILPGIFWRQGGWMACVACIMCMQAATLLIAMKYWRD